jgi:hypothetical protein
VVTEFADAANAFPGVAADSPLKATMQFDLDAPDPAPESYYSHYLNGIVSLSVTVGSYTLNPSALAWINVLDIEDNHPVYNQDSFGVFYLFDNSPQYSELNFGLRLSASPPKNPFSTALPPSVIDLSKFDTATIWLRDSFLASGSPLDIKATITSATVLNSVPEEGTTLSLLGTALIGLGFLRKKGLSTRPVLTARNVRPWTRHLPASLFSLFGEDRT